MFLAGWEVNTGIAAGKVRPLESQEALWSWLWRYRGAGCTVNARPSLGTHC